MLLPISAVRSTLPVRYGSGADLLLALMTNQSENICFSSSHLAQLLALKEEDIMADEDMRRVFTDPRMGRIYEEGGILKRERLAETLDELADAEDPVNLFYKGTLSE